MKRLWDLIVLVIVEILYEVLYFIEDNLNNFGRLIEILLPYGMLILGGICYKQRGELAFGAEIFIPVLVLLVAYFFKGLANKIGKGDTFPVPQNRFTSVDEDGNPEIEVDRVQELILYIYDVEEWLRRKGRLK